jgi:hypothetical protein
MTKSVRVWVWLTVAAAFAGSLWLVHFKGWSIVPLEGLWTHEEHHVAPSPKANPLSKPAGVGAAPVTKVVFLKGTALVTANADGSNVQALVDDGVSKSNPHWSPAGDRIVYWTPGPSADDPASPVNLVVITASGQAVNTIPLLQTESEPWVLFRGVDVGWYGQDAVFATGMVNTVVSDYRVMDVRSGKELRKYSGTNFGTCEPQAKVGWDDLSLSGHSVAVNGSPVYTIPSGSTVNFGITWSTDCSRMAFIESTADGSNVNFILVVVSANSVEAKIRKPANMFSLVPVGSSFMIGGRAGGALLYDTTTQTLRPAPDVLQQIQRRVAAEEQLMKTLGGQSADLYPPNR